jgi:hypothetical protein
MAWERGFQKFIFFFWKMVNLKNNDLTFRTVDLILINLKREGHKRVITTGNLGPTQAFHSRKRKTKFLRRGKHTSLHTRTEKGTVKKRSNPNLRFVQNIQNYTLRYIDSAFYSNWNLFIYHTNSSTILQYYYFTPIRISAFRMPSSWGKSMYSLCF